MNSLNNIIRTVSIVIIPVGALLFFNQMGLENNTLQNAVVKTVAAMIGMIPEGLVLLTSTVLAVSAVRLSRNNVLIQELYCIETLARVDTLCLDKTGTITEGKMEVKDIIPIETSREELEEAICLLGKYSEDSNSTIEAIKEFCNQDVSRQVINKIPFSSDKKWSGITFENQETYILGAPEKVLEKNYFKYKEQIEKYIEDYRVVVLAKSKQALKDNNLPEKIEALGFILLVDKIRPQASKTLEYFKKQGVAIKLISGDNRSNCFKNCKAGWTRRL